MSLLDREEHATLDISGGGLVMTYLHLSATPRVTLCRITLGNDAHPIIGGTAYTVFTELNGRRISPDSQLAVAGGLNKAVLQSREILITQNDQLKVSVDGAPSDTAVYALAELVDMTPITRDEIIGGGLIAVDHNYGGTDNLSFQTAAGDGIERATVQVFLKSDWDAGNRSATYSKGATTTIAGGHWLTSLMLDPGQYVVLVFKDGVYLPTRRVITVTP